MQLIYGEGDHAFIRLQLEIMKLSDDHSIFAWTGGGQDKERGRLLALSPKEFGNCGAVHQLSACPPTSAFYMTNRGLHTALPLIPCRSGSRRDLFLAVLNCKRRKEGPPLAIYLKRLQGCFLDFIRVHNAKVEEIRTDFACIKKSELYIKETDLSRWDVIQWLQPQGEHINYKGFQVDPMTVESLLANHPYVFDAVVIGLYDKEQVTEVLRAYIVLTSGVDRSRKTEEDIVAWLNDRTAEHEKLRGGVRFIDTIPRTPTGKVLRRLLKAMALEEKNAEAVARNRAKL